jgi:hypothetical protein
MRNISRPNFKILLSVIAVWLLASCAKAQYHEYDLWDKNYTVQALFGAVNYNNMKFDIADSAEPKEVDLSWIPLVGGAWGTLPKGDRLQVGLECSFLFGFRTDDVEYLSAGGSGLRIRISTSMWMIDFAGGPYASLYLDQQRRIRLYAAGGPLMIYADYQTDPDDDDLDNPEIDNYNFEFDGDKSVFGIGVYARCGIEFRIFERGMLGLGARGNWANLDFSDVGGDTDVSGGAAFATFTAGF